MSINADNGAEKIADPLYISALLEKTKNSRALLSIKLADNDVDTYMSTIIDIEDDAHMFLLDGIKSEKGHKELLKKKRLSIQTKLEGVTLNFDCKLLRSKKKKAYINYYVKFPDEIIHFQKRMDHRVHVSLALNTKFHVKVSNKWIEIGRLTDISLGGIGLLIDEKEKQYLSRIKQPYFSKISFSDGNYYEANLKLCHLMYEEKSEKIKLGMKFCNLDNQNINKLCKVIRSIERENIRKTSH